MFRSGRRLGLDPAGRQIVELASPAPGRSAARPMINWVRPNVQTDALSILTLPVSCMGSRMREPDASSESGTARTTPSTATPSTRGHVEAVFSPRPMWSITDNSVYLDYPLLNVVSDDVGTDEAADADLDEVTWVASGRGWVAMLSGGSGHQPMITMEAWAVEPPGQPGWRREQTLSVEFPAAALRIWATTHGGSLGPPMTLPPSDRDTYRVRIRTRGDSDDATIDGLVAEAVENGWDRELPLHLEEWLLQFWPV